MKIPLSEIKASPNPIRKTWDEEKMNELATSLVEEGQVEPIGVRTNGKEDEYVIVWGHRRVEAARRCGWDEIDCVIVPNDEINNLIQAGIENLSGEDMCADDKANWAFRLVNLGLSEREIARRSSIHLTTISHWLISSDEKSKGVYIDIHSNKDEGVMQRVTLRQVLGDDLESKKTVATKAVGDRLNRDQTRAVAEAYRDAPPEVKPTILKTPIVTRDTAADILRRATARVELDTGIKIQNETSDFQKEREERREIEAWDFAVKEFLDATKLYAQIASKGSALVKYGKFTPEAARFAIRKIDSLIDLLKTYREQLGEVK